MEVKYRMISMKKMMNIAVTISMNEEEMVDHANHVLFTLAVHILFTFTYCSFFILEQVVQVDGTSLLYDRSPKFLPHS